MYIRETLKIIERLELGRERHAIYEGNLRRLCHGRLGSLEARPRGKRRAGSGLARRHRLPRPLGRREARSDRARRLAHGGRSRDPPHLAPARAPRRGRGRALERERAPGDVVSFQLPNWWEFVALYLATVRLGAVANPLMPIFRRRELRSCCASPNPGVHRAGAIPRLRPRRARARARRRASRPEARGAGFRSPREEFLRGRACGPTTSRSSSIPPARPESRRACCTRRTPCSARSRPCRPICGSARDVIFMPSPLAHQLGFMYGMLMSLMLGIPIVLIDVRARPAAQLIQAQGATFAYAATPSRRPGGGDAKLPSLRVFASAARLFRRRWCRPRASGSASPWRPPGA